MISNSKYSVVTSSRLHFGLLAWGADAPRRFGGLGLMIQHPGLALCAGRARGMRDTCSGPLSRRGEIVLKAIREVLARQDKDPGPIALEILSAPAEHVGLGTGTQLGLGVATAVTRLAGVNADTVELATWIGRGARSGIGVHGFDQGGLIVDGGHPRQTADFQQPAPCVARLDFPEDWPILVVLPRPEVDWSGPREAGAFRELPPIPEHRTNRLCRLVLLHVLPAVATRDLETFGQAIEEYQALVGESFAPIQGGLFSHRTLGSMIDGLREFGLQGVGQSSWGPALYGFAREDLPASERHQILARVRGLCDLDEHQAFWTSARNSGAVIHGPQPRRGGIHQNLINEQEIH